MLKVKKREILKVLQWLFLMSLGGILTIWYLFTPAFCDGRMPAVRLAMNMRFPGFFMELVRNLRPMQTTIDFFYFENGRMPTLQELKELRREPHGDRGSLWQRYGRNRFGQDTYYYYGYEKRECTFFVDPSNDPEELDDDFRRNILPLISRTFTELEHQMILEDVKRPLPQYLVIRPAVCSSVCLDLIDLMRGEHPERYNEIRNELIREKEEGTYERICVLSEAFQRKLANRRESAEIPNPKTTPSIPAAVPTTTGPVSTIPRSADASRRIR